MSAVCAWPEVAIDAIERVTRDVLQRVGIKVLSAEASRLMLAAGCRELGGARLAVPWDAVLDAAASAPTSFTLMARDEAQRLLVSAVDSPTWFHPLGGAPYVCDVFTGEQRRATFADVAAAARVQHHQRYPDLVGPLFMPDGVAGDLEPLISYLLCLHESDRCVAGPGLWLPEQVRGLCEIADIVLGDSRGEDRCAVNLAFSPLSPLTLGATVADALVEAARCGASCLILPCPVAGTTAPAPIAAAVAQQSAEALAGVVLAQAARRGTCVVCGSRLMPCDSRTGASLMGGPELARAAQAATLLCRRLGLPSDVYGLSTDSRILDAQFGFERAIGGLLAVATGPAFVSGMGFMQGGLGGSLEALAIDDEIIRWIRWAVEDRPVDAQALSVDQIEQGALSSAGFLGLRQTRSYMRSEKVQSDLAFRGTQEEWLAGGQGMLERAGRRVATALAHAPRGLRDDLIDGADKVVSDSACRLGVGEVPDVRRILDVGVSRAGASAI